MNCGGDHPKWDCKRPATKSKASRKDENSTLSEKISEVRGKAKARVALTVHVAEPAGTQALPFDTDSIIVENEVLGISASKSDVADTSAGTVLDKDRQPKFDKVAYQRNYMRTYRAKKKEAEK